MAHNAWKSSDTTLAVYGLVMQNVACKSQKVQVGQAWA
jgi:hypothetical protein